MALRGRVGITVGQLLVLGWFAPCRAPAAGPEVPQHGVFEVVLTTPNSHPNPYTDVTLSGTFKGPARTIAAEGFWDGGGTWRLRMAPTETGAWTLMEVQSNDPGLNGQKQGASFTCRPPTDHEIAANEVLRHGFIRVNPKHPHSFMHADGTPFFLMGDTAWPRAFLGTLFRDGDFQRIVDTRSRQGFTVFSQCFVVSQAKAYGDNEGGRPFLGNHTGNRLNPEFFQWADKRIEYMTRKNIRPMIVNGGPDGGLTSNIEWNTRFQRYLIARWSAYDVIWFGVKEYEEWGKEATRIIRAIGEAVQQYDPYGHPASTHSVGTTCGVLGEDAWLGFNSLQSRSPAAVHACRNRNRKPAVVAEAFYRYPPGHASTWGVQDAGLLQGLWQVQLAGGWNAGYQLVAGTTNLDTRYYLEHMDNTDAAVHTHLRRFFEKTDFWNLVPCNDLVKATEPKGLHVAAAQIGGKYVVFLGARVAAVTVDLSAASGLLAVAWYNPLTGRFVPDDATAGGGAQSFKPPFAPAVLHIGGISQAQAQDSDAKQR